MIERYEGNAGQRRLIAALMEDRLVAHQAELAERLTAVGQLVAFAPGDVFISQGDHTNDVFFIVAGAVSIAVNGVIIANRFSGQSVGEMAAVEPSQPRSATVTATEPTVVLKVTEEQFSGVAEAFPAIWRHVAATLSRRLNERNHLVTAKREVIKVFVMSSREALPIVDLMIEQFAHDPFLAVAWKNGVFNASHYTLDDLEAMLDDSDFAVALAYQDDVVITRDDDGPSCGTMWCLSWGSSWIVSADDAPS